MHSHAHRITRHAAQEWFDGYSRITPVGANNALPILGLILNFAVERDMIGFNPAGSVLPNRRPSLSRFLSRNEIRRLNGALDRHVEGTGSAQADMIRLLLLTRCQKTGDRLLDEMRGRQGARQAR